MRTTEARLPGNSSETEGDAMTIRIGANPIGWSNDDMRELGGDTPLETCLAEAREVGFEGIELGHKFPRQPHALRAALAPYDLVCVSGWYSANLLMRDVKAELEAISPHLELLRAMGSDIMVFAETSTAIHSDIDKPLSRRPVLRPEEWPQFGARLTQIGDALADRGVALAYHHHMGTIVQGRDDIANLMDATGPSVKLLLDTGHAIWGGADPVELARTYEGRIVHVHAKDVRADIMHRAHAQDWSFLRAVLEGIYTVPGDGMIDYGRVLSSLPHYQGWIVIEAEQDPAKANPLEYARRGYRHLRAILAETGQRPWETAI